MKARKRTAEKGINMKKKRRIEIGEEGRGKKIDEGVRGERERVNKIVNAVYKMEADKSDLRGSGPHRTSFGLVNPPLSRVSLGSSLSDFYAYISFVCLIIIS